MKKFNLIGVEMQTEVAAITVSPRLAVKVCTSVSKLKAVEQLLACMSNNLPCSSIEKVDVEEAIEDIQKVSEFLTTIQKTFEDEDC